MDGGAYMGKTKIEFNRAGVRELMKSPEMQAILVEHANKIASASETEAYVAQTRAVVKVCGDDGNNGLLKAGWKSMVEKIVKDYLQSSLGIPVRTGRR